MVTSTNGNAERVLGGRLKLKQCHTHVPKIAVSANSLPSSVPATPDKSLFYLDPSSPMSSIWTPLSASMMLLLPAKLRGHLPPFFSNRVSLDDSAEEQ